MFLEIRAAQMPSYGDPSLPINVELHEAIAAFSLNDWVRTENAGVHGNLSRLVIAYLDSITTPTQKPMKYAIPALVVVLAGFAICS